MLIKIPSSPHRNGEWVNSFPVRGEHIFEDQVPYLVVHAGKYDVINAFILVYDFDHADHLDCIIINPDMAPQERGFAERDIAP